MNPGGEPERDDTGLPPVDIEIPDDARELDRDVQAYHRELRAERRSRRRRRLHVGLTRDGVILPLLACCLIFALITGTLLTVFTATSDQNLVTPPPRGANPNRTSSPTARTSPSASSSVSAGTAGPGLTSITARLSGAHLTVKGKAIPLQAMIDTLLVLIPPRCRCTAAVSRLASIGAPYYSVLVATPGTFAEAQRLRARLNPSLATKVYAGLDSQGALQKAVRAAGLTAVVISPAPTADTARTLRYAKNLTSGDLTPNNSTLSVALTNALRS